MVSSIWKVHVLLVLLSGTPSIAQKLHNILEICLIPQFLRLEALPLFC